MQQSMSSEYKIKVLEWCTLLPTIDCPRKSPVLLLKGQECFFRFTLEKEDEILYYTMYVELKEGDSVWKPCDVQLKVGFKKETNLDFCEMTFSVSGYGIKEIWFTRKVHIEAMLLSDYLDGIWVNFQFYFKDVPAYLLKIPLERDDKCLQTASYFCSDLSVKNCIEDYSKLLDTGENHDTAIKCGEHTINAHKIILSARSEVFKRMLQNDMLEGQTGVVKIQDMDVSYLRDFIRYLYTGRLPELTFDKAKMLYEAGDKYDVRSLMLQCSGYLQDTLCQENAFECYALADAHSDEKLKDSFVKYTLEEEIYLQEDVWRPFCEKYPTTAIEIYRLSYKNVSETKRKKCFHC